jgi:hypothetical protein
MVQHPFSGDTDIVSVLGIGADAGNTQKTKELLHVTGAMFVNLVQNTLRDHLRLLDQAGADGVDSSGHPLPNSIKPVPVEVGKGNWFAL